MPDAAPPTFPALGGRTPIAEYAVLGDGQSCALVSRRGSVDWLCLPHFDSPACFAALLGSPHHGRWLLTVPDAHSVERRYVGHTFVLETTYVSPTGVARVTDAMPAGDGRADLVRRVEVLSGTVTIEHEWIVRFGYGALVPWVHRVAETSGDAPAIRAIAGPDSVLLRGHRLPVARDHRHRDEFSASAGEVVELACTWSPSWSPPPPPLAVSARIDDTVAMWEDWAGRCASTGPYREALVRSLLVLRLLTSSTTGGIVAAATTSLPEDFGGERNWD